MKNKLKKRISSAVSITFSILLIPAALIYIFTWGVLVFGRMITTHMFTKRRIDNSEKRYTDMIQ